MVMVMSPTQGSLGLMREARALGARAKPALGTREARAFAGFNEHPLVILVDFSPFLSSSSNDDDEWLVGKLHS